MRGREVEREYNEQVRAGGREKAEGEEETRGTKRKEERIPGVVAVSPGQRELHTLKPCLKKQRRRVKPFH